MESCILSHQPSAEADLVTRKLDKHMLKNGSPKRRHARHSAVVFLGYVFLEDNPSCVGSVDVGLPARWLWLFPPRCKTCRFLLLDSDPPPMW